MSYPLLEKAPQDHHSSDFLAFLRANNVVVFENRDWLVIENCKYHKPDAKHHTAFLKSNEKWFRLQLKHWESLEEVSWHMGYSQWQWLIKRPHDRTIGRFHIHFIEKP